jgi:hypothetical protein
MQVNAADVLSHRNSVRPRPMQQPTKADFDVEVDDAGVHVLFRPTESHYDYLLLADGGLSLPPTVRHAKTGDTGDYVSTDVRAMADELAEAKLQEQSG